MNKRNCNSCKYGMLGKCETLKNNEEYQKIEGSKMDDVARQYAFKDNFICDLYKSRFIEYPIEVSKINQDTKTSRYRNSDIGKFASIRPCKEKYQNKTYLGIYLGDLPIDNFISHNPESKELNISFHSNPAIFVFDLNEIIYGIESWWSIIEKEDDFKTITDKDINNIWYVKALKELGDDE